MNLDIRDTHMLRESLDAPRRVAELMNHDQDLYSYLGRRLRELDPVLVGTNARGSSDHAAAYAAYLIPQCLGRIVASIPPSLTTVLDARLRLKGQFVLSLSQSGGSPDIIRAQERARDGGALTAAIVNMDGSPLAKAAEIFLPQRAGEEKSITATKSVLCTLSSIARFTAEWSQDGALLRSLSALPLDLELSAKAGDVLEEDLLSGVSHVFVLSRALGYGSATEIALKLKETCGIHAEAFSAAEVRHGPREIVNGNYLILALAFPGSGEADVLKAAEELQAQGARVVTLGRAQVAPTVVLPEFRDFRLGPLMALQALYPWIARSARALGRNPDKPKTLSGKVIQTV